MRPRPRPAPPPSKPHDHRAALLQVLAEMPEEAFGWLALLIAGMRGGQVWPSGLGGFSRESQASIRAAMEEARLLIGRDAS